MILTNAEIYTMNANDEIIKNGYVIIKDEKIMGVGKMEDLLEPELTSSNIIDLGGKKIYPGFIDAHTHIGMYEDGLHMEGDDLNEVTDPSTPHLRAIDAINPLDRAFEEAVDAGITTVATGPGSANPLSGQFAAIKTYGKRIDDMIIKAPLSMKMALGENPKMCYGQKNQTPETRMATAAIIRDNLNKAKKYLEATEKFKNSLNKENSEEEFDEPEFDIKCEALLPLLRGEIDAHIHAHRADDIFTAVRIAKEFNLKYTVVHCTEGHLIAEELKKDNVKAIVGPVICDRSKPELRNLSISNASELKKHDVLFSITTDHPVAPLQYLPYCAALAVKGGLDEYEALKAITISPAKILGIDDQVGSIEAGKSADIAVFEGTPLDILSNVKMVIVNGKTVRNNL